jgi:NADPH:quinone reductase-like Zn-dependent oxidoreductase
MMRAALAETPGAPFRLALIRLPRPGPNEVRVRISASGINPLDTKIHMGEAPHARHPLPAILGLDLAGTVDAIGEGVDRFKTGDEVYGMTGGVLGAKVFATGSLRDRELIERLGSTFIDRDEPTRDYVARLASGDGFDRVYDTVGGAALDASFQAVRRFGHIVSCLGWSSHALAPLSFKGASYSGVFTLMPLLSGVGRRHHGDILAAATGFVETGKLAPILDPARFSLATLDEAYRRLTAKENHGKIVVETVKMSGA